MAEPTQIDRSRLRSDAARNRDRIITAAHELFTERGIDVPMTAIARRAEVGAATLFRRFGDRQALIAEVFATQFDRCESVLEEAIADPDPWHGFCTLIEVVCRMQIEDRGFTQAFLSAAADGVDIAGKRTEAEAGFVQIVRRAQNCGQLRPDFAPSDITMILLANGGLSQAPEEHAPDLSRRLVAYLLRIFATDAARPQSPLPRPSTMGLHEVLPSA